MSRDKIHMALCDKVNPFGYYISLLCTIFVFSSCQQYPELAPSIDSVDPPRIASDQERFVVIRGDFSPRISWDPGGAPELSADFSVSFAGRQSDSVRLASATELVTRVPAISEPGCVDVLVTGPSGLSGISHEALCVDKAAPPDLVMSCMDGQSKSLCKVKIEGNSLTTEVIQSNVMAIIPSPAYWSFDNFHRGYRLSSDGHGLLFLHEEKAKDGSLVRQLLYSKFDEQSWPTILSERPQQEVSDSDPTPVQAITDPVISPGGRTAVWLEDECRLVKTDLPDSPEQALSTRVLADICDQPEYALALPDMDILDQNVVFTRYNRQEQDSRELWLVMADGKQPPQLLLGAEVGAEEGGIEKNGPGVFSADGGSVLFLSDRLSMEILSPFLQMFTVTNLYRLDLSDKTVSSITPPLAAVFAGRPEISPDGRMVANTGFLTESNLQILDVLLTDLDQGTTLQVGSDGGPFCYPPSSSCELNTSLGCCLDEANCCTLETPDKCMSWEVLPIFSPNSQNLIGNSLPMLWVCYPVSDTEGSWKLVGFDIGVFNAHRVEDEQNNWKGIRVLADQLIMSEDIGGAPSYRQRLAP